MDKRVFKLTIGQRINGPYITIHIPDYIMVTMDRLTEKVSIELHTNVWITHLISMWADDIIKGTISNMKSISEEDVIAYIKKRLIEKRKKHIICPLPSNIDIVIRRS